MGMGGGELELDLVVLEVFSSCNGPLIILELMHFQLSMAHLSPFLAAQASPVKSSVFLPGKSSAPLRLWAGAGCLVPPSQVQCSNNQKS